MVSTGFSSESSLASTWRWGRRQRFAIYVYKAVYCSLLHAAIIYVYMLSSARRRSIDPAYFEAPVVFLTIQDIVANNSSTESRDVEIVSFVSLLDYCWKSHLLISFFPPFAIIINVESISASASTTHACGSVIELGIRLWWRQTGQEGKTPKFNCLKIVFPPYPSLSSFFSRV